MQRQATSMSVTSSMASDLAVAATTSKLRIKSTTVSGPMIVAKEKALSSMNVVKFHQVSSVQTTWRVS